MEHERRFVINVLCKPGSGFGKGIPDRDPITSTAYPQLFIGVPMFEFVFPIFF